MTGGRVEQGALGHGQLGVAADQRVVALGEGLVLGQQAVAQRRRRGARGNAQFAAQRAVHALVLTQGGVAIALGRVSVHERQMGPLVARIELDHGVPTAVEAQQVQVAEPQLLAAIVGPRVVAIFGQEVAAVEGEGLAGGGDVVVGQGLAGQVVELDDVDAHLRVGQQHDVVTAEHDRVGEGDRPPGEVGGLVELGRGLVDRVLRPDEIDELLAVQASAGRHGQHLDQGRGLTALPGAVDHGHGVDRHLEAAEQRDLDRRHPDVCCRVHHRGERIGDGIGTSVGRGPRGHGADRRPASFPEPSPSRSAGREGTRKVLSVGSVQPRPPPAQRDEVPWRTPPHDHACAVARPPT